MAAKVRPFSINKSDVSNRNQAKDAAASTWYLIRDGFGGKFSMFLLSITGAWIVRPKLDMRKAVCKEYETAETELIRAAERFDRARKAMGLEYIA